LDRIDFLRRKVSIDRQMLTVANTPPAHGPVKTPASIRSLVLADSVGEVLAEHVRQFGIQPGALLFTTEAGAPLGRSSWGGEFKRAADSLNIDASPHDLRHHSASMLIAWGCSVKAVQHFLGHATAKETLDTYGHLWPDDEDRIRAAIDSAMRTAPLAAVG
jgi:integrase